MNLIIFTSTGYFKEIVCIHPAKKAMAVRNTNYTCIATSKTMQDSFRKISTDIIPKLKKGNTSPEIQKELAEELECVILLLQTEEPVIIDVAPMIQEIKEFTGFVLNENDEIKHKVEKLQSLVARHEKEIKTLKDRMSFFENSMLTGQIMSCLERQMVTEILKGTAAEKTPNVTLKQIKKILDGKKSKFLPPILKEKEDKETAQKNWDSLETQYQIEDSFYPQFEVLKTNRNGIAHPNSTTKQAEDTIKEDPYISDKDRKTCMKALDTLNKMRVTKIAF